VQLLRDYLEKKREREREKKKRKEEEAELARAVNQFRD